MRLNFHAGWFPLSVAAMLFVLGCGGAASGPGTTPPPVVEAPRISVQPQSQTVWSPLEATFSVQATGGGTLAYQWRKNGSLDIPGANSSTYMTGPTSVSDHGTSITVVVSNSAGSVTSSPAILSVNEKPTIQQQPGDLSVAVGESASFHVQAQGTPVLRYQWKRNGAVIPGATDVTYTIQSAVLADNGAAFTVDVSNSLDTAVSQPGRLTVSSVLTPPTITQQPNSMNVNVGQTASFMVKASGSEPLSFQWRRNGSDLPGSTESTLAIPNAQAEDAGSYDVVVRNDAGTATSVSANLTVMVTPPTIVTQPQDAVVGTGQTGTFTIVVAGSQPLLYQWRRNGTEIPGATDPSYTTPIAAIGDDGAQFSVRVSNAAGSVTSENGTLRVFIARTLRGQVGTLFQTSSGEVPVGRDLASVVLDVLQPDGRGDFHRYAALGLSDGTFTVPGVPPGPFYLFIRGVGSEPTEGLWTTNEIMDLRRLQAGRSDGVVATSDQAALAVNIQGTLAGQFTRLQTLVPNLGLVSDLAGSGPLYRYPWKGSPLVEAGKDTMWVAGLKPQTTGPSTVTSLVGVLETPPFTMSPTNETRLNVNLQAVSADQTISWKADSDAYGSLLPLVNPAVDPVLSRGPFRVDLLAQPFGASASPLAPWPSILEYRTTLAGNLDSGVLAFGDPYPQIWGRMVRLRQEFGFDLPIPGTSQSVHVTDAIQELWPLGSWPLAPRTPLLSPVLQPKVDNASLFTPPANIGLAPILTWSVKAGDQPSYFIVTVYKVDPSDGSLQVSTEVSTEVPNLAITDGLLKADSYYLVRIVAFQSTAYDPNLPWRFTWPLISAPVYSAVLRP